LIAGKSAVKLSVAESGHVDFEMVINPDNTKSCNGREDLELEVCEEVVASVFDDLSNDGLLDIFIGKHEDETSQNNNQTLANGEQSLFDLLGFDFACVFPEDVRWLSSLSDHGDFSTPHKFGFGALFGFFSSLPERKLPVL